MTSAADYRAEWHFHRDICPHCRGFDPRRPATLAALCIAGAEKLKRALHAAHLERIPPESVATPAGSQPAGVGQDQVPPQS